MLNKIKSFFKKGDERDQIAKKNIIVSFFLKGASILTSLVVVPLTIDFVSPVQYGIWLTLSSIISWMNFFDIGFANGLRNKLTVAITNNDHKEAKTLVSTSYMFIGLISLTLFITFFIANQYLDWSHILNTPASMTEELRKVTLMVFAVFSVQFILQLLNTICIATHNVRIASLISFFGNLLGLCIVFILTKTVKGTLFALSLSIGIAPLVVLVVFSIVLFSSKFRFMSPNFRMIDFQKGKEIISLSSRFFIINIGLLFFYNVDNFIISQVSGPLAVTSYGIAYKYFNVITMISSIIMAPFWPAFAAAEVKNDKAWIIKTINTLRKNCTYLFILSFVMLIMSNIVYDLWTGGKVVIPFSLSIALAVYVSLNMYRMIFVHYLNSINKLTIQTITVTCSGIINVPLAFFLGKHFGATGVVLSTTILCAISACFERIQYNKVIKNSANGLWGR